jgi:hypothetical protein
MALFLALLDQPNYSRTNLETIYWSNNTI